MADHGNLLQSKVLLKARGERQSQLASYRLGSSISLRDDEVVTRRVYNANNREKKNTRKKDEERRLDVERYFLERDKRVGKVSDTRSSSDESIRRHKALGVLDAFTRKSPIRINIGTKEHKNIISISFDKDANGEIYNSSHVGGGVPVSEYAKLRSNMHNAKFLGEASYRKDLIHMKSKEGCLKDIEKFYYFRVKPKRGKAYYVEVAVTKEKGPVVYYLSYKQPAL